MEVDPTPVRDDHPADTMWVMVGIIVVSIVLVDAILAATGKSTMSQVAQSFFRQHVVLAVLLVAGLVAFGVHLVRGF